jgi:uncharacterized protein (TIGR03382 family)
MRPKSLTAAAALVLVSVFSASSALATSNFPGAVRAKLALTYDPECSLCHSNGITGRGTVTTPFGKAMLARGLAASDETALNAALDKMAADKVDSDLDGTSDIDELKAGTNPNGDALKLAFGCNAGSSAPDGGAIVLAVGVGAALLASRRRFKKI